MNKWMVRCALSVGAIGAAVIPAIFSPACLSSSPETGDGGSSSSGGSSGSSGSSSGGATCFGGDAGLPPQCLIDDMTGTPTQTGGYWYTFSDRTIPFGMSPIDGALGVVDPLEGAQFLPGNTPSADTLAALSGTTVTLGPAPTIPGATDPVPFRTFTGGGLVLWGAGSGMDFDDPVPDGGGTLLVTDAGTDGGYAPNPPAPFDGSAHNGVSFWGKSNTGATVTVGVHLADARQAKGGGTCDPNDPYTIFDGGADINKSKTECGDDFLKNVNFGTGWAFYHVTWTGFGKTQGYSGTSYPSVDTKNLFYLHFQVNNAGYAGTGPIAPEPPFSISVAYVAWYDGQ